MRTKTFLISSVLLIAPVLASAQATTTPLPATSSPMCPAFLRSLAVGSRGDDVTELQQFLAGRGFFAMTPTGYYGPITAAAVRNWQVSANVVPAGNLGLGYFGPLSRAFVGKACLSGSGSGVYNGPTGTTTATTTQSGIAQIEAPANVSLMLGGIAEVRNENMYFTLKDLTSDSATIQTMGVGCWNWFPSDPPPAVRCMIAIMPIAPQTLTVGQTYTAGTSYSITLTNIATSSATFFVKAL